MRRARRRAIYDEDKELRRAEILAAARALFVESDGRLATVTDVAERAGIGKGTVYLYFETKEEIYVAHYQELMLELLARMQALAAARTQRLREGIVDATCGFVEQHPDFLRLASLLNGVLEHNVSEDFVYAYKSRIGAALLAVAMELQEALPSVTLDEVRRLLLRSYAVSVGLWQQADLPAVIRQLLAKHADLALFQIDFATELRGALELVWLEPRPPSRGAKIGKR